MKIYSYVVTHDSGFAPNPFGGFLSLATCKPKIRKAAKIGDLIIGTGSASAVGNGMLVYAGLISEILPIEKYGASAKHAIKRPSIRGEWWKKHGDNIYTIENGSWKQRRNPHHLERDIERDVSGHNVLICNTFWYFGKSAIEIPLQLCEVVKKGPGHKRIDNTEIINQFISWLKNFQYGIHGTPAMETEAYASHCGAQSCVKKLISDESEKRRDCGSWKK